MELKINWALLELSKDKISMTTVHEYIYDQQKIRIKFDN